MKKNKVPHYRQGDVLLVRVDEVPSAAKKNPTNIVAYGEVTGHVHEVFGGEVRIDDNGTLFITSDGKLTTLEHVHQGTRTKADHKKLDIPAGTYKVVPQVEYDAFADAVRRVED